MHSRVLRLDLLRAFAITTVFVAHTVLSYGAPDSLAWLQFGGTGVDLFFVLSGWLIGYQLFNELAKHGDIDVKRFWIRRWMRTLPAYYAVLLFTIIQLSLTKDDFAFPWRYFVFLQNYDYPLTFFTVSWSLCVEEQFYLAIAPVIVFLSRFSANQRTVILLVILALPSFFREFDSHQSLYETHVRWDCCIMGILLANLYFSHKSIWQWLSRHAVTLMFVATLVYISFYVNRLLPQLEFSDPSKFILAFVFACWLIWANQTKSARIFAEPVVLYISTRSYAIYLLHPDALAVCKRLISDAPFLVYFILAVTLSCIAAEVLYRCIEQPIMQARAKFKWSCSRSKLGTFEDVTPLKKTENL